MTGGPFLLPEAWPLLLLAPLAWIAARASERRRSRRLAAFLGPRTPALAADLGRARRASRRWLLSAGLLLAVLALMQPSWGEGTHRTEQRGVDLMVCLDVSRSMLARDQDGSRLQRAHREIRALARHVRGDRLGLLAFAGDARLLAPLTRDTESFAELVETADPLSVSRGGTDLGAALEAALAALQGRSGDHEAVVLITDGEDLEQRGLRVARACAERGIAVHCVGVGSPLGSKIAVQDGGGERFLRGPSGDEVVSVMDAEGLRRIADAAGGGFVDANTTARPLIELYESWVLPMARRSYQAEERRERENRFQWPLLLAFLLWLAELSTSERRRPRRRT